MDIDYTEYSIVKFRDVRTRHPQDFSDAWINHAYWFYTPKDIVIERLNNARKNEKFFGIDDCGFTIYFYAPKDNTKRCLRIWSMQYI